MTVIELPDDIAAVLKAKAASQNLNLEDWLRQQAGADTAEPSGTNLDAMFAKARGLADDIDFSRNASAARPVEL